MQKEFSFIVKSRIDELEVIAQTVERLGEDWNLPASIIFNISLALDELITNTVLYGYNKSPDYEIAIEFFCDDHKIRIKIMDSAKAFNLLNHPEPDTSVPLSERKVGGLGIFFVRKFMDSVEYERLDDKNIVTLTKKLNSELP